MIDIFLAATYNILNCIRAVKMEKKWYLYILKCADGTFYTGITDDVAKRISSHNAGKGAKYTRGRGPVELGYCIQLENKSEALKAEYRTKQLPRSVKAELCSQYLREGERK